MQVCIQRTGDSVGGCLQVVSRVMTQFSEGDQMTSKDVRACVVGCANS